MEIYIPEEDDPYFLEHEKVIDADFEPIFVNTILQNCQEPLDCFNIVREQIQKFGGKLILGWQIWKSPIIRSTRRLGK